MERDLRLLEGVRGVLHPLRMRARPIVVHEEDAELESWGDAARGAVRWRTLLSGDRTASAALTLGVAELPPGADAPRPHRHAPPEAYYILEGTGVVEIDGREHAVRTGSAVFLPAGASHCLRNTGPGSLRLVYVFPVDSFEDVEYVFPDEA